LNLSQAQGSKIEKINDDFRKNALKKYNDIKAARTDINDSLKRDNPDFSEIRSKIRRITDIQLQVKLATVDAYEKAYDVLNKNQKVKLSSLLAQFQQLNSQNTPQTTEE